ncbi:cytochrome P450 [Xylaria bambusicola]|uniref:cytochrome P450 n=1 Tax=Xylaria bambusicola TaxID=326684 RepID=UPI002007C5B4|nr:cytochrome P450 [Xylaria bambusicola]KAI0506313.1 cytochrome P450 [Xylaria bambusicola]
MEASPLTVVLVAFAINCLVSPIPEVSTELYVFPYIAINLAFYFHLCSRSYAQYHILTSIGSANSIFLTSSAIISIVRRLFFSPLRKFPGPKLAAVSGLWNAIEAGLGRASRTHKALHEKYTSDIIRIGPNELSINSVDAIEKLYGGKYIRGTFNQVFNIPGGENVATLRDQKLHGAWRRMLLKAFSKSELSRMTERIQTHVDRTIAILHQKASSSVDCGQLLDAFAFDVISHLGFSYDSGFQDGYGDMTPLNSIPSFLRFVSFAGHLPHLQQILRYLPLPDEPFIKLANQIMAAHESREGKSQDILSHLLVPDTETNLGLSPADVKQHVLLLLTVGAHSIGTTLTCIFAALASRPEIQENLRKEIDSTSTLHGVLSSVEIGKLKLLESVVKEALRMFGPLQGGTPAIVPKGGIILDTGIILPEYTQVYVGQHVIGMDERYFIRAKEFLPERWMEDSIGKGNNSLIKDRRAWIPFGYGTHACGGRALAIEELKLMVARVIREFRVDFPQDLGRPFDFDAWVDGIKDHFLTVIEKMELTFTPWVDIQR